MPRNKGNGRAKKRQRVRAPRPCMGATSDSDAKMADAIRLNMHSIKRKEKSTVDLMMNALRTVQNEVPSQREIQSIMMFALTRYNDALDEYGERLPSDFRVLFKNALKRVLEESIYGRMNQQMIYNACMKMYEVKPDNRSDALTILPTPLKTMLERRAKWHSMK